MSNIFLKVTIESFAKLWFSRFKRFVTRPVFGELQLTLISPNFNFNFKSEAWEQNYVWFFHYINFERNYDVLKLKEFMNFVEQKYKL